MRTSKLLQAGVMSLASATVAQVVEPPPNIVILFADDAGYMDFGFTGTPDLKTARIDQLASEGIVCTQAYVSASVCSPSRAGMLTGRYQQRFGHEFNLRGKSVGLPVTEQTLADRLGALGYRSSIIGKWHLGSSDGMHPLSRGFDEFRGFLAGSRTYFPRPNEAIGERSLMRDREVIAESTSRYLTDWMAEEAKTFIHANRHRPFFLYVAFNAVHTPMQARLEDLELFPGIEVEKRRKLAGMTISLDRAIGEIMDALQDEGLDRRTLVFFLNDNGGATTNASNNGPLRGMKGSKWEGGIRVPYVVRWPGNLPTGKRYDQPISSLDIVTTALTAAGADTETMSDLDGVNLLPHLSGKDSSAPHEILFWRRGNAAAVREGRWKLLRVKRNPVLLFDLENDIGESTDLAEREPEIVERLLARLTEWEAGLVEPLWVSDKKWQDNQVRKHRMDVIGRQAERSIP